MYAVIRVRGETGASRKVKDTLRLLNLGRQNYCVIVPKDAVYEGMLKKSKAHVTWGEISSDVLGFLISKRGRLAGGKKPDSKQAKELAGKMADGKSSRDVGLSPVFRLSPPSGGYRSVKRQYPRGALGYRGEGINDLLKKMI